MYISQQPTEAAKAESAYTGRSLCWFLFSLFLFSVLNFKMKSHLIELMENDLASNLINFNSWTELRCCWSAGNKKGMIWSLPSSARTVTLRIDSTAEWKLGQCEISELKREWRAWTSIDCLMILASVLWLFLPRSEQWRLLHERIEMNIALCQLLINKTWSRRTSTEITLIATTASLAQQQQVKRNWRKRVLSFLY